MSAEVKNKFVFVVCGGREHIETLHFSLRALVKYSVNEVIVITDTTRNEIPLIHHHVIDIKTPEHFDNHQASIFLKTGLHKFLPASHNYCYLDSDVIALNKKVDEIFELYHAPVTFCTDITRLDQFSPFAIKCGCLENFERDKILPAFYEKEFTETILSRIEFIDSSVKEIERLVALTKKSALKYFWHRLKYLAGGKYYQLDKEHKLDKVTGQWYLNEQLLSYKPEEKTAVNYIQQKTGFTFNPSTNQWYRSDGSSVSQLRCNHLHEFIKTHFEVNITPADWQHWNGGVFLFARQSHAFLDYWHAQTLQIFEDKMARTRDQATLAATVWKFGLQNHYTLPLPFNFIADSEAHKDAYAGNLQFRLPKDGRVIQPNFIHVYRRWADKTWAVWNDITKHIATDEG